MQNLFKVLHIVQKGMIEQDYLNYCLSQVEKKLNWKKSSLWKESDFIKLADTISNTSEISISPHTLKRLFGKIKYKEHYNPQQATKNALSKFLGYASWEDFVKNNKENIYKKETAVTTKNKRNLLYAIPLLIVAIVFVVYSVKSKEHKKNKVEEPFLFALKDSVGTVPFTVQANYDFSKNSSDSIYIDYDFKHPVMGDQIIKPDKNKFAYNFTYQIPGYYQMIVKDNLDTLKTKNILAMSKGWNSYLTDEGYIGRYWMDNKMPKNTTKGFLYYSPDEMKQNGMKVPPVYYLVNRIFKKFNIDGDNFTLKTKFKNAKAFGGITCYDFILRLYCENNRNSIKLMETGCSQFSGLKFGENTINGSHENLSDFKINPEEWNTLYIKVHKKNVKVSVNNIVIYTGNYTNPNGNIVGVENSFKGSGMLDYIKIKDLTTGTTYFNDFD